MRNKITTEEANRICCVLESEKVRTLESENYKNIKPTTGMTKDEATDFWNCLFK